MALFKLFTRHLNPASKELNDDVPQVRLSNGASGKYDGARVKTDGPSPAGALALLTSGIVCRTMLGRILTKIDPILCNVVAPFSLPLDLLGHIIAVMSKEN